MQLWPLHIISCKQIKSELHTPNISLSSDHTLICDFLINLSYNYYIVIQK